MIRASEDNEYYELSSPTILPKASGFLWNEQMMIHMNCRGYAVAQFMQPEPAKYSYAPNLEAKTFMQPEQPYYAHHPGRFVYVKDEENGELFSAPYEPVRTPPDHYTFAVGKHNIVWTVEKNGIAIEMTLSLPKDDPMELWRVKVTNLSAAPRKISIYPYFTIGYMSWMNQSGEYKEGLQAIVATAVTPYQKYQDYAAIKHLKDKTFLLADHAPASWEVNQEAFEGEGGIGSPSALKGQRLAQGEARYETPVAALQYSLDLAAGKNVNTASSSARPGVSRESRRSAGSCSWIPMRQARTDSCAPSGNMRSTLRKAEGALRFPRRMRISTIWSTTGCPGRCTITGRPTA